MERLKILETTLRDGSYAINFQFTANDTRIIAKALEEVGFEYIEIGHGVGLNASNKGKGKAIESDEQYLKAASKVLTKAKFGMFCIPGIAELDNIEMASDYGMQFIRIGTNVAEAKAAEKFIKLAKKKKMFVTANFMKSYTLSPKEFAQKAKMSQSFGADVIYIVDSAGGMLPGEIEEYFHAIRKICDIPIGYHGHNNLGLAVSNSLRAVELGVSIIDSSLQGLGRSSGNAPTEIIITALLRMGIDLNIEPLKVMDISEKYILPLINKKGLSSIDIVSGYAQFHSSYIGVINKYSNKYQIDPRKLIIKLCAIDRANAPEPLVERLAKKLNKEKKDKIYAAKYRLDLYYGNEQEEPDKNKINRR